MGQLQERFDRAVTLFVRRASPRIVAAVALGFYLSGLVVPLLFSASAVWIVAANLLGTIFAATIVVAWFVEQVEARDRRHLVEWTTDLRLLDAAEFEWLTAELFRREGCAVEVVGRQDGPDGGVDLRLSDSTGRRLVQCKRWTARQVGVEEVRGFAGALLREGLSGADGTFVTLSGFTSQAVDEAKRMELVLVDGRALHRRMEKVRRTEPCPACASPMVLDRSVRGWWFRCVAPACHGKRDLGRDPGRAVELLVCDTNPSGDR